MFVWTITENSCEVKVLTQYLGLGGSYLKRTQGFARAETKPQQRQVPDTLECCHETGCMYSSV